MAAPQSTPTSDPLPTRERLLDAAERLFARNGVDGVSLRTISAAANANSAAIHYHFGSREALLEQVIARRMSEVRRRRGPLFEEYEQRPTPRQLVRTLALPLAQLVAEQGEAGQAYVKLLAQLIDDRPEFVGRFIRRQFGSVIRQIERHCAEALPHVPSETLRQRLWLSFQVLLRSLGNPALFGSSVTPSAGLAWDAFVSDLVDYLTGGLEAGVSSDRSTA